METKLEIYVSVTVFVYVCHCGLLTMCFYTPLIWHRISNEAECVSTYIQSDITGLFRFAQHLMSELFGTLKSSLLHHITVGSTQPPRPQCNTVCGRNKSDRLCDLCTLWGCEASNGIKALMSVCPTCDEVATCKHCYMWGELTFHWLHLCLVSDHESLVSSIITLFIWSKLVFISALSLWHVSINTLKSHTSDSRFIRSVVVSQYIQERKAIKPQTETHCNFEM